MRIEGVYFDLDGTLVKENSYISPEICESIKKYKSIGGKIGIATGRSWMRSRELADLLLPNLPLICYNGNLFWQDGKRPIYHKTIPSELYSVKEKIMNQYYYIVEEYIDYYTVKSSLERRLFSVAMQVPKDSIKIGLGNNKDYLMARSNEKISELIASASPAWKMLVNWNKAEEYSYIQENKYWISISAATDKVSCLSYLRKYYNIQPNALAYFANDYNDVNMLRSVGMRVVMKNSCNDIKRYADYIIEYSEIPYILELICKKYS